MVTCVTNVISAVRAALSFQEGKRIADLAALAAHDRERQQYEQEERSDASGRAGGVHGEVGIKDGEAVIRSEKRRLRVVVNLLSPTSGAGVLSSVSVKRRFMDSAFVTLALKISSVRKSQFLV